MFAREFIALLLCLPSVTCLADKQVSSSLREFETKSLLDKYIEAKWLHKRFLGFRFDVINVQPPVLKGDMAKVDFQVRVIFDRQNLRNAGETIVTHSEFRSLKWKYTASLKRNLKSEWDILSFEHQENTYRRYPLVYTSNSESFRLYGRFGLYLRIIYRTTKERKLEIGKELEQLNSYPPVQKQEFLLQKSMATRNKDDKLELFDAEYYWAYDSLTPFQKLHVYEFLEAGPEA
jgi:hypothetical protein